MFCNLKLDLGKKNLGRNPRSDRDLCKKGNKSPNRIWKNRMPEKKKVILKITI